MTWNSFAFFISFRSGFASLVSVGSCRIFKRMLYREGALISSCSRMRPADKEDAHSMEEEFWGWSCIKCLIFCHFQIYLATKTSWIRLVSAKQPNKIRLLLPFLIQPIYPPTLLWQANGLQTYQENLTPNSTLLFHRKAQNRKNFDLHPPTEDSDPTEASWMFSHSRLLWYHITGSILAWWKVAVNPLSPISHVHVWWARICLLGFYLPLKSAAITTITAAAAAAVAYWAPIFTFDFLPSHSGRKLSGRCCDEITMSFCLRKELQNAGMKEAGLMEKMITCQWYKRGWSSEKELEKDGFLFCCGTT